MLRNHTGTPCTVLLHLSFFGLASALLLLLLLLLLHLLSVQEQSGHRAAELGGEL